MHKQYIANQIITRGGSSAEPYKFRDQEKQNSALISLLCGMVIGLTVLGCVLIKSCAPDAVAAYSMCEGCGEVITGQDHGRCQVYSYSGYVTNENGLAYFAVRGPSCE